jgi:cytoskeletal protein CcmA (bactofilin family)
MWNKKDEETPAPAPSAMEPRTPAPAPTSTPSRGAGTGAGIGKSMRVRGDIFSGEDLYVDGEVEGTIDVKTRLTVGPNGNVTANLKAAEVEVLGTVKGNVDASTKVVIRKGANIVGDVQTAGIVIDDGAYFKGGIDITRPEKPSGDRPASKGNGQAVPTAASETTATRPV